MKRNLRHFLPKATLLTGIMGVTVTVITAFSSLSLVVAQSVPKEVNIVTGGESGVYYSIARDIEKLARKYNLDIDVIPTRGALQNIDNVFRYDSVSLGLTQGDVFAFFSTFANDDDDTRLRMESLRVLMPLYQEEVHLITRKDIKSVQDLQGKVVSIGEEGSGTGVTAATLLYQWGINPQKLVTYDVKRSIDALRDGEIQAFFYVAGVPSQVLQEQIFPEDNFHILPLYLEVGEDDDFLPRLYSPITLSANTYRWQREDVPTFAVQSFLFTVEGEDCEKVLPVVSLIKDNLSWLRENGNPVWKGFDLKSLRNPMPERMSQCVSN